MKVSLEAFSAEYVIHSYGSGEVRVSAPAQADEPAARGGPLALRNSFIISPGTLVTDWGPEALSDLRVEDFGRVAALKPEVVIFGSGSSMRFPAAGLLAPLLAGRIGVEVMATPAACRTYNILAGEGRNVAAALLMP